MSEDATRAIVGSAALVGLGAWAEIWWVWLPMLVVFGLCVLGAISEGQGPAVSRSELGEIEERLREIQRSVDAE